MGETLLKKSQIIQSFENLPEEISANELIERILFVKLIQERIKESEEGKGMPHEEFIREFDGFKAKKRDESQTVPA